MVLDQSEVILLCIFEIQYKSNEFELMLTNDIRFKETTDLPELQVF